VLLPSYAALLGAIALGVVGQLLFKSGAARSSDVIRQFLDPLTIAGFAVYAVSAVLYVICLRKLPLSIAFPSVSLSYVAVAVAGYFIWHEPMGLPRLSGIALIVLGVAVLNAGR
jgi:multidrug transporter EmrE-like cation transporter